VSPKGERERERQRQRQRDMGWQNGSSGKCLPNQHEALSSNTSNGKKKKKRVRGKKMARNIKTEKARCKWLIVIMLATWKTEIGKISVQDQPEQKVKTPLTPINQQLGTVGCVSSQAIQEADWEDCGSRPAWAKKVHRTPTSIQKSWAQWYMPIIPAMERWSESVFRRISVETDLNKKETLCSK
jgi:hypothetical protein